MSEPIPEAIPMSADRRSRRPIKRLRGENTAIATQANEIENLMWEPERPVEIPALSSDSKSKLPAPPEIVTNVQGSSAGAGSGEFHVYKASRRREYERLRTMDEEAQKEDNDSRWAKEMEERRKKDEEKTKKNRERRNKRKGKAKDAKDGSSAGDEESNVAGKTELTKKPLRIPKRDAADEDEANDLPAAEPETGITIHDDD